jgi:hypothetical protein
VSSNLQPVALSVEELAAVIGDLGQTVLNGDSFEGNIEFTCMSGPVCPQCNGMGVFPTVDESCGECEGQGVQALPPGKDFWVRGVYRIGNREGQGGVRMIGEVPQ